MHARVGKLKGSSASAAAEGRGRILTTLLPFPGLHAKVKVLSQNPFKVAKNAVILHASEVQVNPRPLKPKPLNPKPSTTQPGCKFSGFRDPSRQGLKGSDLHRGGATNCEALLEMGGAYTAGLGQDLNIRNI